VVAAGPSKAKPPTAWPGKTSQSSRRQAEGPQHRETARTHRFAGGAVYVGACTSGDKRRKRGKFRRRGTSMKTRLLALVVAINLAFVSQGLAQQQQEGSSGGCCPPCQVCAPLACDLFQGLRSLLGCVTCGPTACPAPACQPVACPAPEPCCPPPVLACARARIAAVGHQLQAAVCCPPPACPEVAQPEKPVACPPVCRPTLLGAIQARLNCLAPQCPPRGPAPQPCCTPILSTIMGLLGFGVSPCCQQVVPAEQTPTVAPTDAPANPLKPLPQAPPKPDTAA